MVETAEVARIRAAMQAEGAVFLLGPAGQGKTEWAKRLAAEYLDGFELVQVLVQAAAAGPELQMGDAQGGVAAQPPTLLRTLGD